jgi:hypothetical protein
MCTKIHPFEASGLGKAPFQFKGMYEDRGPHTLEDGTQVGSPGQPMGTCHYCGMGIAFCCAIESSDGRKFIVGTDCVKKTYKDSALTEMDRALANSVDKAVKERQSALRRERSVRDYKANLEWLNANREILDKMTNPRRPTDTLWQSSQWMMRNAGHSGIKSLVKALKKQIEAYENGEQ